VIVVADASPLHYLLLIEHVHVLPGLYGRLMVPPAVLRELRQQRTPEVVRSWLSNPPPWFSIETPGQPVEGLSEVLGPGEREAIALASELTAVLLIDDRDGRREAERKNVEVLGTLRVLYDAAEHGFADLALAFSRLRQTNFRASDQLMQHLLSRDRARGERGKG